MKHTDDNTLYDVAELFKNFSDSTRIRILYCLIENERSVTEIADLLNMNQSAISHQLRILKNSKLIKNRREGKTLHCAESDDFCPVERVFYEQLSQSIIV